MAESLVFPVSLDVPAEVHVGGRRWYRPPELHVTTFTPDDLAQATGLPVAELVRIGERLRDELEAERPLRFDGRMAEVGAEDGRRTLVAFCDVDGLRAVYERLSALAGRELPQPPTHVTLYTAQPGMGGIGLTTRADVEAKAVPLPAGDAQRILAALR
jgi:hypothetical protein